MRSWFQRLRSAPEPVADADWRATVAELRLLDARAPAELALLRRRVEWFLGRFRFSGAHGLEVTSRMRLLVATQACLPMLHLPDDHLGHWHELILYPGQFRVRRSHHDSDTEVVSEWDDELAGEAWSQGPVILSWADVEQDLAEPFEGYNVVIHEIAHKIDMADGYSDGVPPLPAAQRGEWLRVMQGAFDALAAAVEAGRETVLDPYAAEAA
jgi:MtfA peptidase